MTTAPDAPDSTQPTETLSLSVSPAVLQRLEAIAQANACSLQAAADFCLTAGMAFAEEGYQDRRDSLDDLRRRLDDQNTLLHLLGPHVLGLRALLAHWMKLAGGSGATEDELKAEVDRTSTEEWAMFTGAYGLLPPEPPDGSQPF